jgi:hypothetical protein
VRSLTEVRQAKLETLAHMVRRPDAWSSGNGASMQTLIQCAIGDLCFIDERDDEYSSWGPFLRRYGKLGVGGAFRAVFGEDCNYVAEVASVFAQIACSLGYLEPARRLSAFEWQSFVGNIREKFGEVDLRRSAVLEAVGEPGFVVGDRVLCYVGPAADDWVAFDCWEEPTTKYVIEDGYYKHGFFVQREEDPLLRCVRIPAPTFNDSLVMTIYGKVLRWGPGWWLDTEPDNDLETPEDVRAALLDIHNEDPSESLGLRRPWIPPRQIP